MHHGQFIAVAVLLISVAAIVSVLSWSHSSTATSVYSALLQAYHDGSQPTQFFAVDFSTGDAKLNSERLVNAAREGARWGHTVHSEGFWWAIALAVFGVLLLGYHFWTSRY